MPAMEAIRAATINAADLLGETENLGALTPGKYADLVAVKGNPLDDISILETIDFVMKDGEIVKKSR